MVQDWETVSNVPVFFNHKHQTIPIGKIIKAWIEENALIGRVKFATEEDVTGAEEYWKAVKSGFLQGISIGAVSKSVVRDPKNKGFVRSGNRLLEASLTGFPMNTEAVTKNYKEELMDFEEERKALNEKNEALQLSLKTLCTEKENLSVTLKSLSDEKEALTALTQEREKDVKLLIQRAEQAEAALKAFEEEREVVTLKSRIAELTGKKMFANEANELLRLIDSKGVATVKSYLDILVGTREDFAKAPITEEPAQPVSGVTFEHIQALFGAK